MATTLDVRPLEKLKASLRRQIQGMSDGALSRTLRQCAVVYRSFLQKRYVRLSRGGGDWQPLAPSTIARRRKGKVKKVTGLRGTAKTSHKRRRKVQKEGGRTVAILRDTGVLFGALDSGAAPGAKEQRIPGGIRVGYGGGAAHPGGKATIADIAGFHQEGGPNLPRRAILVPPDAATAAKFVSLLRGGLAQEIADAGTVRVNRGRG